MTTFRCGCTSGVETFFKAPPECQLRLGWSTVAGEGFRIPQPPGKVAPDTAQGGLMAVARPRKEGNFSAFVLAPASNISLGPLLITLDNRAGHL